MTTEAYIQLGTVRYYLNPKKLTDENGQELSIRSQSLEVLNLLAKNPNKLVLKDELFGTIWKSVNVTDDSLVQCISNIRRLLKDSDHKILQTLPKKGYRLMPTVETSVETLMPVDIPADRPAIAVMRFKNIGVDHTGDVIAAGLSTDIHYNLAKMSRLFVIAQASASRLKHLISPEIGKQLGIRYLVQGTTQRSTKQVRATISLVEAESNRVLWTEQYDRSLDNFLQLQDDITRDVVTELDHLIEQHEIAKAFSTPPDNLGAWELYHRGLWHFTRTNLAGIEEASRLFRLSLALDPNFSPAYAALSCTYIHRIFVRAENGTGDFADKALDYAYQGLEHDHCCGWGHWALGRALYMKSQHGRALAALNLSIKYKPNFSWNYYAKAMITSNSISITEALPAAKQALRLSPVDPNRFGFLSAKTLAFIQLEDYEEAATWGVHAAKEPRAYHLTHALAALALKLNGQAVEAEQHIVEAFIKMPGFCLQNFRNILPHEDEESPSRVLTIGTLKKLGVPEVSNG